jgi:chlorobactene glucosyltransferase
MSLLILLLVLGMLLWLVAALWNLRNARGYRALSAAMDFPLEDHPWVSILIPARNEAGILVSTLPRFLEQEYDNYEVIVVDDGSTDGTSQLAERFQKRYPKRLRVIRVEQLAPGWNGKIYALHNAFQAAQGEWVLATDADIVFHPKALGAGLWLAREQRADLVTIFAFAECVSFWEKLLLPGFSLMLSTFFPFRKINDARSSVAVASGGYILMRREVWAGLGGYESIRSQMIDDLNTARIVKHSGHRIFAVITRDLLTTRMYENFRETWEGLRKHAFAGNRYSVVRLLTAIGAMLLVSVLPLASLFYSSAHLLLAGAGADDSSTFWIVLVLSSAQLVLEAGLHLPFVLYLRINAMYAFLAPLGNLVYACISLDSMTRTLLGEGVSWKLRHYGKPPVESQD